MMRAKKFLLLFVALLALCTPLAAREVIGINDNWKFYFSNENSADYARTISLPHTWAFNTNNSLVLTQPTTANYIKELYVPESWSGKRLFVKFYGVESVADILINGHYAFQHRGGGTAFCFEVTNDIIFGQNNRLHVIVNNAPQSDVLPTSSQEDHYGGIYRDVELIVADNSVISPIYYGSDGVFVQSNKVSETAAEGIIKVHLNSKSSLSCLLNLTIIDPEGSPVYRKSVTKAKIGEEPVAIPFIINSPALWSNSTPNLYKVVVSISDSDSSDQVSVTTGFRSIDYSDSGAIKINGEPTPLNCVTLFHDYPHVGGAAAKKDIEVDMELITELGANAIRSATRPHHPHLYDLCDEKGVMAWIDIPLVKSPYLSDIAYFPTEAFHSNAKQTLCEIIAQNYNHPSVVMWGIFTLLNPRGNNPIPLIEELNTMAKTMDPNRPTVAISDQDGQINSITDLIVWNQSLGWDRGLFSDLDVWSNLLHTKWNNMRSGVVYGQNGRFDQQASEKNFKSANASNSESWYPEGRQREFHEQYAQRLLVDSLFWGVCINSMFDFKSARNPLGENSTGLVSFDRRNRKDIFHLYKSRWNKNSPTLYIADKRNRTTQEPLHKLTVYASDTTAVTLFTPHDTVELTRLAPWHFTADSITLSEGVNKLIVQQGELLDSTVVVFQNISAPATTRNRSATPFSFR